MTTLKLIGICGRKRHGKDILGDYLVKHHGYTKISFADALKDACKCIFGFNDEQLYGNLKEATDEFWKTSPRKVLQYVGTELFRLQISELLPEVNEDIWVKVLENKILQNPDTRYVITDVRFANELGLLKKYRGLTIKVQRDIKPTDEHISESFIDQLETDCIIKNNGTLEQLYEKLNNILAFKLYCKYVKISNFEDITPFRIQNAQREPPFSSLRETAHEVGVLNEKRCKLIDENTLYVFDIDETLMVYDGIDRKWWKKKMIENHENEHLVIDEWLTQIANREPKHTHASSFNTFLENVNKSNIVCLTARKESLRNITEEHLAKIGVNDIPVYYSNGSCKGKVLKEIIIPNYSTINNIVFVDDNKNNICSVNKAFYNEIINVQCYYFMHNL